MQHFPNPIFELSNTWLQHFELAKQQLSLFVFQEHRPTGMYVCVNVCSAERTGELPYMFDLSYFYLTAYYTLNISDAFQWPLPIRIVLEFVGAPLLSTMHPLGVTCGLWYCRPW